jgi:hypothetical protein
MFVFDWASLAKKNPKWIAQDQIHCSNRGYEQRASAIAQETRRFVPRGMPAHRSVCCPYVGSANSPMR